MNQMSQKQSSTPVWLAVVIVLVVDKMKSQKNKKEKLTKEDLMDLADYTEDAYLYSEKNKK